VTQSCGVVFCLLSSHSGGPRLDDSEIRMVLRCAAPLAAFNGGAGWEGGGLVAPSLDE
jgi:hypothetical protein